MNRLITLVLLVFLYSCGSSNYVSTSNTDQMDDKFSNTDLRMMSQDMYESINNRLNKIYDNDKETPVIAFLNITNKTTDYIDTEDIADKLQIYLIQAGQLRFVDRSKLDDMVQQFDLAGSGMMDQSTAQKAGKVLGNDYFLSGDLSSITKSNSSKRQTYYRLSMQLVDAETNEIVWADESEVKKEKNKSFIDW